MNSNDGTRKLNIETISPSSDEMLQYLVENGLIDKDDIRKKIIDMHIEKIITDNHSHKIWQGKDNRWYTYINDPDTGKRKLISRKEKRNLIEFLSEYEMIELQEHNDPTIRQIYPLWLEHKSLMAVETYIPRIQSDWKKYYEDDPIVDQPITQLKKLQLENWVLHLIRDNNMTKTCYYNVSMIIRQIFRYAYDAEIIDSNPFDRVKKDLGKFFRDTEKPEDETQIYFDDEIYALENLIWQDFARRGRKKHYLAPLAVLFQLYTGLRVSEVCALQYSDILPNGKLFVHQMLVRDTGEIREKTKGKNGKRKIYLSSKARDIIDTTIAFRREKNISCMEYIFSTTCVPIPEGTINDYLKRYCKRLDIPYRSSHKLRKTAVSSMVNSGISLNAVREFAGHVDEKTTLRHYTFDRERDDERNAQFEKALSYSSNEKKTG